MSEIKADVILDCKGLACPMPIVKTRKAVKELDPGKVIEIEATDKGSKADLKAWAEGSGHQYLGTVEKDGVLKHYVRKSSGNNGDEEKKYSKVINNAELLSKINNDENIKVLDVREQAEYIFSHIPGAISIPMGELEERLSELNKDDEIYVICRTGNRSDMAAQKLDNNGFKNVVNVIPGMSQWDGPIQSND